LSQYNKKKSGAGSNHCSNKKRITEKKTDGERERCDVFFGSTGKKGKENAGHFEDAGSKGHAGGSFTSKGSGGALGKVWAVFPTTCLSEDLFGEPIRVPAKKFLWAVPIMTSTQRTGRKG